MAVCEQVEEAAAAAGLVRREITRILTPGTVTDPEMLEESRNNYLAAITSLPGGEAGYYGLAAVDVSTGDFRINEWAGEEAVAGVADELLRLQPAECIYSSTVRRSCFAFTGAESASEQSSIFSRTEQSGRSVEQWGKRSGRAFSFHATGRRIAAAAVLSS